MSFIPTSPPPWETPKDLVDKIVDWYKAGLGYETMSKKLVNHLKEAGATVNKNIPGNPLCNNGLKHPQGPCNQEHV